MKFNIEALNLIINKKYLHSLNYLLFLFYNFLYNFDIFHILKSLITVNIWLHILINLSITRFGMTADNKSQWNSNFSISRTTEKYITGVRRKTHGIGSVSKTSGRCVFARWRDDAQRTCACLFRARIKRPVPYSTWPDERAIEAATSRLCVVFNGQTINTTGPRAHG